MLPKNQPSYKQMTLFSIFNMHNKDSNLSSSAMNRNILPFPFLSFTCSPLVEMYNQNSARTDCIKWSQVKASHLTTVTILSDHTKCALNWCTELSFFCRFCFCFTIFGIHLQWNCLCVRAKSTHTNVSARTLAREHFGERETWCD